MENGDAGVREVADAESTDLRRVITYDLPYYDENGEERTKHIKIRFVSQAISRQYYEYVSDMTEFKLLYQEFAKTQSDAGSAAIGALVKLEAADGSIKTADELEQESAELVAKYAQQMEQMEKRLKEFDSEAFFNKRFKLVYNLLKRNAVDDEDLYSRKWWDESVDTFDMVDFITAACTKDVELVNKKKDMRRLMSSERTGFSER